jgi:cell division protein FtsN
MARDYKRNERPSASASKKGGHPMLAGVLIGLFIGLAAAIGVAIYINRSPSPFVANVKPAETVTAAPQAAQPPAPVQNAAIPAQPAATPAVKDSKDGAPAEKQRFEFYDILQGKEAPVTEQEVKASAAQQPAGKLKENYFLQAGAFQTGNEADNLKAKLAFLGVEAVIQTADIPEKGVWHRVRVGPFANIEELNKTRGLLSKNGIQAALVKIHE